MSVLNIGWFCCILCKTTCDVEVSTVLLSCGVGVEALVL